VPWTINPLNLACTRYEDILLATQQAAEVAGTSVWAPYRALMRRQYRPQLVITVLVRAFVYFRLRVFCTARLPSSIPLAVTCHRP